MTTTSCNDSDERRLKLPTEVARDSGAMELVSVWFSNNKVKIMTRSGTGLDEDPTTWGEILSGIGANIAQCRQSVTDASTSETLAVIRQSLNESWPDT